MWQWRYRLKWYKHIQVKEWQQPQEATSGKEQISLEPPEEAQCFGHLDFGPAILISTFGAQSFERINLFCSKTPVL